MKKMVEVLVFGSLVDVEIIEFNELLHRKIRYIGTDFSANVDIYEENITGDLLGCIA